MTPFFLVPGNISLFECTTAYLSFYLLKDIFVFYQVLVIMNKAAINSHVQVVWTSIFNSFA